MANTKEETTTKTTSSTSSQAVQAQDVNLTQASQAPELNQASSAVPDTLKTDYTADYTPNYLTGGNVLSDSTQAAIDKVQNATTPNINGLNRVDTTELENLIKQQTAAATEQYNNSIDYATNQSIKNLQRTEEDAAEQYQTQRNQVDIDEAKALSNQSLYASARGDKGGIGQAQYSVIQNNAATNRLTVQKEQTKLATDVARQIEDLRAQGEYEKADKALELAQNELSQLMSLYQWATETNLSVDQFNVALEQWKSEFSLAIDKWNAEFGTSLDQWNANYKLGIDQYNNSLDQWNAEYKLSVEEKNKALAQWNAEYQNSVNEYNNSLAQWQANYNQSANEYNNSLAQWRAEYQTSLDQWNTEYATSTEKAQRETLANAGNALLSAGIMPSEDQLSAMGLTKDQAQSYIAAVQAAAAASSKSGSGSGSSKSSSSGSDKDKNAAYWEDVYLNNSYDSLDTDDQKAYKNWESARKAALSADKKELQQRAKAGQDRNTLLKVVDDMIANDAVASFDRNELLKYVDYLIGDFSENDYYGSQTSWRK